MYTHKSMFFSPPSIPYPPPTHSPTPTPTHPHPRPQLAMQVQVYACVPAHSLRLVILTGGTNVVKLASCSAKFINVATFKDFLRR